MKRNFRLIVIFKCKYIFPYTIKIMINIEKWKSDNYEKDVMNMRKFEIGWMRKIDKFLKLK